MRNIFVTEFPLHLKMVLGVAVHCKAAKAYLQLSIILCLCKLKEIYLRDEEGPRGPDPALEAIKER